MSVRSDGQDAAQQQEDVLHQRNSVSEVEGRQSMKKFYKVYVKVWSNDQADYFWEEYSGVLHSNYKLALKELHEAEDQNYEAMFCEED